MYVFSNIDHRGNRVDNRKEFKIIEITKPEAKFKAQCTQASEGYQVNSIPQFWQEKEHEIPNLVGSNPDMILADWRTANVLSISKRVTYAVTNPLVWPQLL